MAILPIARSITICDHHIGFRSGKVDLYGILNAIRPRDGFPYFNARFCVFAQLINGLGRVPFFIAIRSAETDDLVWTTQEHELFFESRTATVQMAMNIEGCRFEHAGVYLVALFCDNKWVCDTRIELHER